MKVIVIGTNDNISNEKLTEAIVDMAVKANISVKVHVFDKDEIIPSPTVNKSKSDSPFIQAIQKIFETCGDITRNPGDRAHFFDLVIRKVIERPILEVLAFGPKNKAELSALRDAGGDEFIMICKTALALSERL